MSRATLVVVFTVLYLTGCGEADSGREAQSASDTDSVAPPSTSNVHVEAPLTTQAVAPTSTVQAPSLGSVSLGDTPEAVQKKVGTPTNTEHLGDHLDLHWGYKDLDVYYFGGSPVVVGQIEATGPAYCTVSGVCPGSTLSQVIARLGAPVGAAAATDGTNAYLVDSEACWLELEMVESVVKSLAIRCQP